MKATKLIVALAVTTCFSSQAQTQKRSFFNDWSVGVGLNHNYLRGDALSMNSVDNVDLKFEDAINFGIHARIAKQISPVFDLGFEFNSGLFETVFDGQGTLKNASSETKIRNYHLTTRLSLSRLAEHNGKQPKVNFYLQTGIGYTDYKATTFMGAAAVEGSRDPAEPTIDDVVLSIPVGAGIEIKLTDRLSLDLSSRVFLMDRDNVDGLSSVSGVVPNTNKDYTVLTTLGLVYDLSYRKDGQKGFKWNNSYGDMTSLVQSNTAAISSVDNKVDGLSRRVDKLEKELQNKQDKRAWKDADGDGVHDEDDMEPNTPKGQLVNFQGKSIEINSDAEGKAFFAPVYFAFNSARVSADQYTAVANMALFLQDHPSKSLTLVGYADKSGNADYNRTLSRKRTEAVKKVLMNDFQIEASRINTESKGEDNLKAKLDRINRRVDFVMN